MIWDAELFLAAPFVQWSLLASGIMTALGIILAFYRLALSNATRIERLIALDLMTTISIGVIALFAIYTRQSAMLDAALVIALIAFLGTIAVARYLEFRVHKDR